MCIRIREALKNKTLYELKAIAKTAGIKGVADSPIDEMLSTICEECRTNQQVRDRVLEQLNLTFLHRHWRSIVVIGLVGAILTIVGFFLSFLLPEKVGPVPAPNLQILFKSSRNAVGHGILQKSDLPLSTGALFQIHGTLSEPGYAYLFHLSEGETPTLLYPSGGSRSEPIRELYDPPLTENPDNQVWHTLEPPAMTVMLLLLVAAEPVERTEDLAKALAAVQPVKLLDHVMLIGDADHPRHLTNPDRGGWSPTVAARGVLSGLGEQWRQKFRHVRVLAFSHVPPDSLPTSQPTSKGSGHGRSDSQIRGSTRPSELDLDAFIASLSPPTVEEITESLEPIPTLAQLLDDLKHPERLPPRPVVAKDVAKLAKLTVRIGALRKAGLVGHDRAGQDAALAEAVELAERVLAIRLEHQGPDSPAGSKWTNAQGHSAEWWQVADARRAVVHLVQLTTLNGSQRNELAEIAEDKDIVRLHRDARIVEALVLVRRQFEVRRRLQREQHSGVATSLNSLAALLQARGDLAAAELLFREALVRYRNVLGDEHPAVADNLNNLASLLYANGNLASAEPLFCVALSMNRRLRGDAHTVVTTCLNNVAALLQAKGDYVSAEALFRDALTMDRKLLGDKNPDLATTLNNLASSLQSQGDYASAEPLFRKALAQRRTLLGDEHPLVATSLNNLASLLHDQGAYAAADVLYREALESRRRTFGVEHLGVAQCLNNLAMLMSDTGMYAESLRLHGEALKLYRKLRGGEHLDVATSLTNQAAVLRNIGDYAKSLGLHREALEMYRKLLGGEHPHVATGMNNQAVLLNDTGDYDAAEQLHRGALALRRKLLGDKHPDVARSLNNLAQTLRAKGEYAAAEPLLIEMADIFETSRLQVSTHGGLDRAVSLSRFAPLTHLVAVHIRRGKFIDAWRRMEAHFARGLLDEIALRRSRPLSEQERDREDAIIFRLNKLDERISALLGRSESIDRDELRTKLQRDREMLQAKLVQAVAATRDKYGVVAGRVFELAQIQRTLTSDAVLIGWIDVRGEPHAANPDGEHWAWVLRNTGEPIWVELRGSGAAGRWTVDDDALPDRVYRALTQRAPDFQPLADALYRQRLAPIEPHLEGASHLIVLPTGRLARVPIESLTNRYAISYAPSGTMYAWLKEKRNQGIEGSTIRSLGSLLALGDAVIKRPGTNEPATTLQPPPNHGAMVTMVMPNSNAARSSVKVGDVVLTYGGTRLSGPADLGPAIQRAAVEVGDENTRGSIGVPVKVWRNGKTVFLTLAPGRMGASISQRPAAEAIERRRSLDRAVATRRETFDPLPATRREVTIIQRLFGAEVEQVVLLGSDASEQRLAELADAGRLKDFRYLHFATHAALDDQRAMNSALILSQDNLPDPYEMVLGGKEPFDGRLTAEQIVRTWKLDADLVTLSACQTALGKQAGGEGFLGFSQALFVAGARSLVLSLWKVDDLATMLLMQRFYENLLGRYDQARSTPGREFPAGTPLPKVEALREAKRAIRDMTWDQAKTFSGLSDEEFARYRAARGGFGTATAPRGELKQRLPFAHPYYWAAFILIGNPG